MKPFLSFVFWLLTLSVFGQSNTSISEKKALEIAAPHGLHANWFSRKSCIENQPLASLDSTNNYWIITTQKLYYTNVGKTTKSGSADSRVPCKKINGCHVWKKRSVYVDSKNGKILKTYNLKIVSGNYE
jgi:hypothetical protein